MTRNGGEAVLVGVPRMDVMLNLNAAFTFLYLAKTVKGCWYGSANVREDVPKLAKKLGIANSRPTRHVARISRLLMGEKCSMGPRTSHSAS